jgi:ATP-dependent Zn protease
MVAVGDDVKPEKVPAGHAGDGIQTASTSQALRPLARLAVGRSGADIERLVREARSAARRDGRTLRWSDLVDALGGERSKRPHDVRWRMAVHETGHALVQLLIGSGTITLVSIDADHGGMVRIDPDEHRLETEAWTMDEITVRLAGRIAEELIFGNPLAGSGGPPESDLAVATDLAVMMETSLGFGRHQPLLYRSMTDRSHMLALDARLAARVNARLEECSARANAILAAERDTHLWLANTILRHGVLEGPELDAVLAEAGRRIGPVSASDIASNTELGDGSHDEGPAELARGAGSA